MKPEFLPDEEAEKKRYLLHTNSREDADYVKYLETYIDDQLAPRLKPGSTLLDFGCGRVPVLGSLLEKRGFTCARFDKFFFPDQAALAGIYDAVVLVEVLEHLYDVQGAFSLILRLVREDGLVFIRTQLHEGLRDRFLSWWYVQDPTHVAFYSARTMRGVSRRYPLSLCSVHGDRDIVFRKSLTPLI
jgi:2-polyprenyl-3-methyl-5-hydroxy-6-metoxy-1,4-benzoquinol methylase